MGKITKPGQARGKLRVGDRGMIDRGRREIMVEVIEDRGMIGVGGRQLVRIRVPVEPDEEPVMFEMPAEEIRIPE